jgi:hypothetical protein
MLKSGDLYESPRPAILHLPAALMSTINTGTEAKESRRFSYENLSYERVSHKRF